MLENKKEIRVKKNTQKDTFFFDSFICFRSNESLEWSTKLWKKSIERNRYSWWLFNVSNVDGRVERFLEKV